MFPTQLTLEIGRIHAAELRGRTTRPPAAIGRGSSRRRRGLGEQLEAVRRRLELGRQRRGVLSQIQLARYTGARI